MKKNSRKNNNTSNLVFSACLVTAFVVCAYFFEGMIKTSTGMSETVKSILTALLFVVFGLFLFYATRVGDGKQVKRFSLSTLIIMDLPALYIILASFATGLPFSEQIASSDIMVYAASVVLGYGVPYTFLSGYEIQPDEQESDETEDAETDGSDDTDNYDNEPEYDEFDRIIDENNKNKDTKTDNSDDTENYDETVEEEKEVSNDEM